jgi:GT2 family glycosyltransferase
MNDVLISIVIPAHEHEGMTRACVESVLKTLDETQTIEVIVVDDCSPVPIALTGIDDSRVRVVRTSENLRFSRACNYGAAQASGRYLLFLNNDTAPNPGWLTAMVATAEADPRIGVVGARLLYRDGTVQHAGVAFSQRDGVPRHVYRGFPGDHPVVLRDRSFQAVTAACILIRSEAFAAVDGFDGAYNNGYEDIDLCLRLRDAGYRTHYCGSAVVEHFESVSRRGEVENLNPAADPNLTLFLSRWADKTQRDELNVYADDELLWVDSGEIYPLVMRCAEELAVVGDITDPTSLARLLNIRSHQVFDLEKEIGYLTARLLDNGIQP